MEAEKVDINLSSDDDDMNDDADMKLAMDDPDIPQTSIRRESVTPRKVGASNPSFNPKPNPFKEEEKK